MCTTYTVSHTYRINSRYLCIQTYTNISIIIAITLLTCPSIHVYKCVTWCITTVVGGEYAYCYVRETCFGDKPSGMVAVVTKEECCMWQGARGWGLQVITHNNTRDNANIQSLLNNALK